MRLRGILATDGQPLYYITARVLNARNHGLPQCRQRLFIVGHKRMPGASGVFQWPKSQPRVELSAILDPDASEGPARLRLNLSAIFNLQ
jgi:site-specific DNA-cytosine methylase